MNIHEKLKTRYSEVDIYGVSGVARTGKDSFGTHLSSLLKSKFDRDSEIISFASALKEDIDPFLQSKIGVSSFTSDDTEKKLIRPMLVAYGMTMRKLAPDYWIKKISERVQENAQNSKASIITDVRFPNEVDYIKSNDNSCVIHLRRSIPSGELILPANDEELKNDPLCAGKSDILLLWKTFDDTINDYLEFIMDNFLGLD